MILSLCLGVETLSRRPATTSRLALTADLLDLKALFHPQLFSKSRVPGTFSGQDAPEGTGTPRNEPLPNRLSLGASIIHVLARSSPARNRSRRFSVTYICAGKGSPGLGGWVGVVARIGRRTPQPSTPSGSRPLPIRSSVGRQFSPRAFPVSARRCLCGRLKSQAGGRRGPPRRPGVRGRQRRLGFPVPVEAVAPAGRPLAPERRDGNFSWVSFPPPTPVLEETVLRGAPFGRRSIVRASMGLWVLAEAGKDPTDHSCPLATPAGRRTRCTTRTETRSRTSTIRSLRAWGAPPPRCAMPTRSTTPRRKGTAAQPGTGREKGAGDGSSSRCFFIKTLQSFFSRAGPHESES